MSICSVVVPCLWGLVRGENIYVATDADDMILYGHGV